MPISFQKSGFKEEKGDNPSALSASSRVLDCSNRTSASFINLGNPAVAAH